MFETDRHRRQERQPSNGAAPPHDFLEAENISLRLLLAQAEIDAQGLLAQAGIDAREREASDKLQKLILEELHHRIKNTLATVSAIATQSLRHVQGAEHAQHAIAGRLQALGRAHDLLLQARWNSADLGHIVRSATEAFDNPDVPKFSIAGPDIRMTSGAVIAIAMTLNELCTNTTKFGALSEPTGRIRRRLDAGSKDAARAPDMDRNERSSSSRSGKPQFRDAPHRDAGQAAQGRRAVDVSAGRFRLRDRRAVGFPDVSGRWK
jgi:two-component sensor histidine kinase